MCLFLTLDGTQIWDLGDETNVSFIPHTTNVGCFGAKGITGCIRFWYYTYKRVRHRREEELGSDPGHTHSHLSEAEPRGNKDNTSDCVCVFISFYSRFILIGSTIIWMGHRPELAESPTCVIAGTTEIQREANSNSYTYRQIRIVTPWRSSLKGGRISGV